MTDLPARDRLFISRMRIRCIIGLRPHERVRKQDVLVSVTLHTDLRPSGVADDLKSGIDYSILHDRIVARVEGSSFSLIESLAEHVARACLEEPRVHCTEVTVEKPRALAYAESVGVTIVRERGTD